MVAFDPMPDLEPVPEVEGQLAHDPVFELHAGGKMEIASTVALNGPVELSMAYTPGVARVCEAIAADPQLYADYTWTANTVAVVTDGTAVLGLGDIGPRAAMPVMEGKAVLFKQFGGIDAIPICLDTTDPDEIVETVVRLAPSFGGINLEDISAPRCFEIEERLRATLDIPVFHDDQHGTAVVVLAALLNATRLSGIALDDLCVGVVGLGAAGLGISRLLLSYGVKGVVGSDINQDAMRRLEEMGGESGDLARVMAEGQAVIATTGRPGLIAQNLVRSGQIILALSNPIPEIEPQLARDAGALFAADGRSVNNALGFPGLFRGALEARARRFTEPMKIAAAKVIAQFAEEGELVPSVLHPDVHHAVAEAVTEAALASGAQRAPGAEPA